MQKKNYYLIGFTLFVLFFLIFSGKNETEIEDTKLNVNESAQNETPNEITDPNEINKIKTPKTSGSWILSNFTIDDDGGTLGAMTWLEANATAWCDGAGTPENPYIIENVTINGQEWYNCIKIQDSTAYFIIRNCTLYNTSLWKGTFAWSGTLELENVQNGKIIGCNVSNNYWGIWLENSANNLIANNTCVNSGNTGITLAFAASDSNTVIGNNVSDCYAGISLYGVGPSDNTIENNFINSSKKGIGTYNMGDGNNLFTGNTISHCEEGITLQLNTDSNTITKNTINNCTSTGINITDNSDDNIISNNLIAYNEYSIDIDTSDCSGNTFYHNNFTQNTYNAIDDGTSNNWDNGYIGNYWHNYTGTDADDDGCGTPAYDISGTASNQDSLPFCDDNAYNENTLHVDDDGYYSWNWEFSSIFLWNSGTGTESDPYIIEDLTIDASPGNGILIENSNVVDFIIRNCTISDAAPGVYDLTINGGIKLISSSYGQIYSNDLTSTTGASVWKSGICLYESKNLEIINNTCNGNTYGIFLRNSNENLIFNNSADSNNDVGIFLQANCHYNNITQNSASSNEDWFGIAIYTNSDNNNIINNTVINNGHQRNDNDLAGICLWSGCSDNNIINNTLTQNFDHGVYLKEYCHNNTIRDNTAEDNGDDAIRLENNCDDNKIIHNSVSETAADHVQDNGIFLYSGCDKNTIINNIANSNYEYGIILQLNCHNNAIHNNTANNNGDDGIRLTTDCSNNIILNNTVKSNLYNGISLYTDCLSNQILNNTITNPLGANTGILVGYSSHYNIISGNTVSDCLHRGILIWDNSDYNNITSNIIYDTQEQGIHISPSNIDNTIIIGNILWNTIGGIDDDGTGTVDAMNCIDGVCTPIIIDDDGGTADSFTWAEVLMFVPWFYGAGSWSDPYIIEDIEVDAEGSGSGLTVQDSSVIFIIRNCNVTSSGTTVIGDNGVGDAGIKLVRINNSRLLDNNCSFNGNIGIMLNTYCNNNTILGNTIYKNSYVGIYLRFHCYNNTISGNTVSNTTNYDGIYLNKYCYENNITGNLVTKNGRNGIVLTDVSRYNIIKNNNVTYNQGNGLHLYTYSSGNLFIGNNVSYNVLHGMHNGVWCDNNNYTENTISFNGLTTGYYGINVENQADGEIINGNDVFNNSNGIRLINRATLCEIFDNNIINNTGKGVFLQLASVWYCIDNLIYNNTFINNGEHARDDNYNNDWNNTVNGNYWDDYEDVDADDDGFGDDWYLIPGTASLNDKLPIWWDAPVVTIQFPSLNDLFGNDTIDYEITVDRANLNDPEFSLWYVLDNGTIRKNATFTELTGTIIYYLWNNFSTTFINITFYANDSRGWIGYMNVTIEKDLTIPIITIQKLGFLGASGVKALNFTIYRSGRNLDKNWYRILNNSVWTNNYTFSTLSSWIEESLWDSLLNGTYTIQFFLNDTSSRLDFTFGTIIKDIWAPVLLLIDPSDNDVVGEASPIFEFNIIEGNLHKIWYNLNNTYGNFTYINEITSEEWENLGHGTLTITFWANDTAGNTIAVGVFVILIKDLIDPIIDDIDAPILGLVYGSTAPVYSIDITETNFDYIYYTLYDGTNLFTSLPTTQLSGSIDQSYWNQLNNGQINITFIVVDEGGNLGSDEVVIIREVISTVVPSDGGGGGGGGDDEEPEGLFPWYGILPWWLQAMVTGAISAIVGVAIKISYNKFRKKQDMKAMMTAPTVILKKKYKIVHHDFLTEYGKVEKSESRVGIAQIGLSYSGGKDFADEYFTSDESHMMRLRQNLVEKVRANIKGMVEQAHENGINILLFPEMTFDLNVNKMRKDVMKYAQEYNMYIITGGYHDIKTKQNICVVFGPEGIQWSQEKHNPATIKLGETIIKEGIEIAPIPHKLHIASTEYGRIAIAICRDFLDMDLRVELKNCEPPVDLVFNPAWTPVTADFEAIHFDARRSIYAYQFFANVAEFGGTIIQVPEKDRTIRTVPAKEEGLIFKDVDIFSLRSERRKWEQKKPKEKRFIQSTR